MLFGYHLGYGIFERCSAAIRHIMKQHAPNALMNYIDDLIYIGLPSKIHDSYQFLLSPGRFRSADESQQLIPPDTQANCLGILVNTITRTI